MLHESKRKNIGPYFGTNMCISLKCVLRLNGASAKATSWTACLPAESVCCQMAVIWSLVTLVNTVVGPSAS